MHDSCVFTLLNWLCASRIGLGWTHAVFTIAYHMLMHFHAYVLYILYILIYWLYWYFSNCLPLYLSFSPSYISCVMAPKRKSTPSWNPFPFGVSSSSSPSDPTPSYVRFRDEKAKSNFFENFSWCGIHSEHQLVLLDFSNTDLPTVI